MQSQTQAAELPAIGTPVYKRGQLGYVSRIVEAQAGVFVIGRGMQAVRHEIEMVFDGYLTQVGDGIAAPWLDEARRTGRPSISPEEVETRRAAAVAAQTAARDQRMREHHEAQERAAAFKIEAAARMPRDAKAVIVAELHEDDSDSMTDYFGHKVRRTVILAWSTHTRDLFPELRKAALNFAETAELHDAPEKAEHHEKYSMGAGFYLKHGFRDSSGWSVKKVRLYDRGADNVPVGEWCEALSGAKPQPAPAGAPKLSHGFSIEKHHHTKGGFDMWLAIIGERVERSEYDRLLAAAKSLGGWYSRAWNGTPAGFAFKSEAAALEFAGAPTTDDPIAERPAAAPAVPRNEGTSAKLRDMADRLQKDIDHKLADRLSNTPKRQREAQAARLDGYQLQRAQQAMRALADHYDANTVPAELRGITTKAEIVKLAAAEISRSGGYYDAGHETGRPYSDTPAARALWDLLKPRSAADQKADELRQMVDALKFSSIPGYFPTPRPIVARMLEAAELEDGMSVLEPEAGSGAILDEVRAAAPSSSLAAFECHYSLRKILLAKGYNLTGADFMEAPASPLFDRVLMNPPFEAGQDMAHVRHAFEFLKPGGRLVAIMSPGPFFRSDRKSAEFREWFEGLGGECEDLPAGAFKESGTGVATVLVTLCA